MRLVGYVKIYDVDIPTAELLMRNYFEDELVKGHFVLIEEDDGILVDFLERDYPADTRSLLEQMASNIVLCGAMCNGILYFAPTCHRAVFVTGRPEIVAVWNKPVKGNELPEDPGFTIIRAIVNPNEEL